MHTFLADDKNKPGPWIFFHLPVNLANESKSLFWTLIHIDSTIMSLLYSVPLHIPLGLSLAIYKIYIEYIWMHVYMDNFSTRKQIHTSSKTKQHENKCSL